MTDDLDRLAGYGRETKALRALGEAIEYQTDYECEYPSLGAAAALAERIKSELELAEQFAECKRRRERDRERIAELEAEAALVAARQDELGTMAILEWTKAKLAIADDYIAALEAENKRLKCCGNCEHLFCDCGAHLCGSGTEHPTDGPLVDLVRRCVFTPSRWTDRKQEP